MVMSNQSSLNESESNLVWSDSRDRTRSCRVFQ